MEIRTFGEHMADLAAEGLAAARIIRQDAEGRVERLLFSAVGEQSTRLCVGSAGSRHGDFIFTEGCHVLVKYYEGLPVGFSFIDTSVPSGHHGRRIDATFKAISSFDVPNSSLDCILPPGKPSRQKKSN